MNQEQIGGFGFPISIVPFPIFKIYLDPQFEISSRDLANPATSSTSKCIHCEQLIAIMEVGSALSSDLALESQKHIRFLQGLHRLGVTLQTPSPASLKRYAHFWLPLVAQEQDGTLMIPPPDVAWLWHCHRLAPTHYEAYLLPRFGRIIEANPPFHFQVERDEVKTDRRASVFRSAAEKKWKVLYPGEPFFLKALEAQEEQDRGNEPSPLLDGFDLLSATQRQATFLWQVAGTSYRDPVFLKEAVIKYVQFLKLPSSSLPIVPTIQIDLMWHTHILVSLHRYNEDCLKIRQERLSHDDSLSDRSPGGLQDRAYEETVKKWQSLYQESYVVVGGMYRGEPPRAFFDKDWDIDWDPVQRLLPKGGLPRHPAEQIIKRTGLSGKEQAVPPSWLSLDSYPATPYFQPLYLPMHAFKDSYATKKKDKYILGRGPKGFGYYHIFTKEAYAILYQRLRTKEQSAYLMHILKAIQRGFLCCCPGRMSARKRMEMDVSRDNWRKLTKARAYLEQKLLSEGPSDGDADYFKLYRDLGDPPVYSSKRRHSAHRKRRDSAHRDAAEGRKNPSDDLLIALSGFNVALGGGGGCGCGGGGGGGC